MYRVWLKKTIILFLLSLFVVSLCYKFIVINRVFYNVDYKLSKEVTTLLVGASHLEVGFDDSKYDHVKNFSISGMPYYFTYPKVKKLLDNNPQVNKLVISFSPIHISPYGDSALFTDEGLSREYAFNYFPLLESYKDLGSRRYSVDFLLAYLKYNLGVPFNYMEDIKPFLKSLKGEVHFSDLVFSGSYVPRQGNKIEKKLIEEKAQFYFGGQKKNSVLSILAIQKIADLTKAKGVSLYILNMPVYKVFRDLMPQEYVDKETNLMMGLSRDYQHIKYVDYYTFPLSKTDFLDGDHVNPSGAEKLADVIENDLLLSQ